MTAGDVMRATKGSGRPVATVEAVEEATAIYTATSTPAPISIGNVVATNLPVVPRTFVQAPLPEGKGSSINFRLTREMHQRLKAASFSTGLKIQAIIERAVTRELDDMGL
jgi:hypothetical protein